MFLAIYSKLHSKGKGKMFLFLIIRFTVSDISSEASIHVVFQGSTIGRCSRISPSPVSGASFVYHSCENYFIYHNKQNLVVFISNNFTLV